MQIELDAATVAKLTKQAEAQSLQKMVEQIMAQFDAKQIAGEVKNAAIRAASQRIATEIKTTHQTSAPGGKHEHCRYFVLDLDHDTHAAPALAAYAQSCATTHPVLAGDLLAMLAGER